MMNGLESAIVNLNEGALYQRPTGEIFVDHKTPAIIGQGTLDLSGCRIQNRSSHRVLEISGENLNVEKGVVFCNDQKFILFNGAINASVKDTIAHGATCIAEWNGVERMSSRCFVENLKGSFVGTGTVFDLVSGVNMRMTNCVINGKGGNSHLVRIKPKKNAFIDTVYIQNVGLQSYTKGDVRSGADFGIDFNTKFGKIVNVWIDNSYFDHTTVASFRFIAPHATSGMLRNIRITNPRADADVGRNVLTVNRHKVLMEDLQITNPHFHKPARSKDRLGLVRIANQFSLMR